MTGHLSIVQSFTDLPLFGQEDMLDFLLRRLLSHGMGYRQNIAVIGRPKIGKTRLVMEACGRSSAEAKNILPVRLDLAQHPSRYYEEFVLALLTELYRRSSQSPQRIESAGISVLSEAVRPLFPKTVSFILQTLDARSGKGIAIQLSRVMDTLRMIQGEEPLRVVLVLDGFERFCESSDEKSLDALATSIMLHKDILFLLAGHDCPSVRKVLHSELNLLFGRPELIEIHPLDFSTAKPYLRKAIGSYGIEEPCADFLMQVSDGHPFYIQVLGQAIKSRCAGNGSDECLPEDIVAAMAESFCGEYGPLNVFFRSLLDSAVSRGRLEDEGAEWDRLLLRLASGGCRMADLAEEFARFRGGVARQRKALAALVDSGLVLKDGSFYRISDVAFAFWVRTSFKVSRVENLRSDSDIKTAFSQLCLKEWGSFFKDYQSPIPQRIRNLIAEFRNDRIEVDSRAKTFPQLRVNEASQADGIISPKDSDNYCIFAERGNLKWFCMVAHAFVTENLIKSALSDFHKPDSGSAQNAKLVLMCLRGIHPNARLIAKEKNVLVLGLKNINKLLYLYGKNKIIPAN